MNNETFNSRNEAVDFGKDYEYLMAAYYSLLFSLNDEISDFKVSTNNNDFGDFDDVVIEVTFQNGENHIFAIQLKHFSRVIAQIILISNKKFNLQKYSKNFKDIKKNYEKNSSYVAEFENIHFILFSNSYLENNNEISAEWSKLEPVANSKKVETDFLIRKVEHCFSKQFIDVSEGQESHLYEFKTQNENSEENEFFKQFLLITGQKCAKEMESYVAQLILSTFKASQPNVAISYLKFFEYWCRRDFGVVKLQRTDVRLKLAELVLSPYIPEPQMHKLIDLPKEKFDLLFILFFTPDLMHIKNTSDEIINTIWSVLLFHYKFLDKNWSNPLPGVYIDKFVKNLTIPISAYSESFNVMSLKRLYILTWHAFNNPLVVKIDKNNPHYEDILLAVKLTENGSVRKKVILISENTGFTDNLRVLRNLLDFSKQFQKEYNICINLTSISLQGRKPVLLADFLAYDDRLIEIITISDVILMINDNFSIGNNCTKDFPKYYIKRSIPKILLDIKVITELADDIFVLDISNYKNDDIIPKNSVDINYYLNSTDFHYDINSPSKEYRNGFFIVTTTGCTKYQFQQICSVNPKTNCHYVRFLNDHKVEWISSARNIQQIQEYRLSLDSYQPEDFVKDEDILSYFSNEINIVCAEPGMGKTVLMKNLMQGCPSDHWVVMIRLWAHIGFFKKEHTDNEILNYFLSREYDSLLAENIVDILSSRSKILFLWDGFDEVPQESSIFVIKAIQLLANRNFPQWIAGRMNSKEILQTTFNTFALTLPELINQSQTDYVYFCLKEKYQEIEKIDDIIDKVNKNITTSLNCAYFDYTGVPLHLHMVVEIYLQRIDLNNKDSAIVTLTDIYQQFIEGKFNNLFKKAEVDFDNHYMEEIREEYKNAQLTLYANAAVTASFGPEILQKVNLDCNEFLQELKKSNDTLGLIVGINDEQKAVFAHKTYEEFLTSFWLSKNYHLYPSLVKLLFEEKYDNIRMMFDMLLARDSPIHLAVLYRNLNMLEFHKEQIKSCRDKAGRNPLHIACSWGRRHLNITTIQKEEEIVPMQKTLEEKNEIYLNLLKYLKTFNIRISEMTDVVLSSGVFEVADNNISTSYNRRDTSFSLPNTVPIDTNSISKITPDSKEFLKMLTLILEGGCDMFQEDSLFKWNAIQYADYSSSIGVVDLLLYYKQFGIDSMTKCNDIP